MKNMCFTKHAQLLVTYVALKFKMYDDYSKCQVQKFLLIL